ncbi:CARDB domain-containing protein [Paenibacillus sp. FSL H7-0350]|uniref:CARDB domain-containing protein n=1 Tax=Paenibacillus sp. FSL H7-0350 TaxID=2975345 RepID=UPI0031589758
MIKKRTGILLSIFALLLSITSNVSAAEVPMLRQYVNWEYGKQEANGFAGYIPALDKQVNNNPWQLYQWAGLFTFSDGQTRIVPNYDVFNVKRTPVDQSFSKENGFGLVFKSESALGDLFDSIWAGQPIETKQRQYFRNQFLQTANDPIFKKGHEYYYTIQTLYPFLRTSGIVPRMGIKFNSSQKISDDTYRALYDVSPWPKLTVSQGNALNVAFSSYGYSERDIRVIAVPKGAFPDLSKVVSLTDGKLIHTAEPVYNGNVSVNAKDISKVLGKDVDIIVDDGYGRTAIKSITLPDEQALDFVPTKLTLTDGGQLWVKFRYDGDDIIASDYVKTRGMPMNAAVKIGGVLTAEFSLASMNQSLPATILNGQEFNYMLGKIEIGDDPGKYYIKVDATINNPVHQDRALESPAVAYNNNMLHGEWMIERVAPKADLIAVSITASPGSITKGGHSSITGKVKNDSAVEQNDVLIRLYDNASKIYETRKSFAAGQTLTVGPFNWTGTSTGVHNLTLSVDPEKEKVDQNRSNNIVTTGCSVVSGTAGGGSECNQPEAAGEWSVSYPVITGYPTKYYSSSYTTADGKTHYFTQYYTDYGDPNWSNTPVTYQENLKISAEVNTKQGIATDLNHPKESDRESRGSWEIIPYAKRSGKDANAITRAGYGIELKVNTTYTTNWETKIPTGLEGTAYSLGGTYYGPDAVYATFYDSNWKFERQVKLEKTGGDRNNATWELPLTKITSDSGKVYQSRKYMTSVNTTDGYYRIKISTDPAGMNSLVTCITKQVEIYGGMYDDVQNVRRTN